MSTTREWADRRAVPARTACFVALLVAALAAAFVAPTSTAGAAATHRAAVIVNTGTDVHRVVIAFSEDAITGAQARFIRLKVVRP